MAEHCFASLLSIATVITDATACVGGNTVSFARHFKKVQAIELDESRFHQLTHNLRLISTFYSGSYFLGEVTLHKGDCLNVCAQLKQDVVFVDPPWGGSAYKKQCGSELYLSGMLLQLVVVKRKWL